MDKRDSSETKGVQSLTYRRFGLWMSQISVLDEIHRFIMPGHAFTYDSLLQPTTQRIQMETYCKQVPIGWTSFELVDIL